VSNFHPIIITCWRVLLRLCKLFVLQYHCDFNEHDFSSLMRDQNIQRKKCDGVLLVYVGASQ
jgi:hypothetical protein